MERIYEILYLLPGDTPKNIISSISNEVEKIIKKYNGKIIITKDPEYKDLAYKIKNYKTGYYILTLFKTSPENLPQIHKDLRYQEKILRFIITKSLFKKIDKEVSKEKKESPKKEIDTKILDKKIDEILTKDLNI